MDNDILAILMLIVGLVLVVAEILIPSGGVIGLVALACVIGAVFSAWQAWWETAPVFFWIFFVSMIFFLPTTVVGAFYILPKTYFGRRLLPQLPSEEEVVPYHQEEEELRQLVGKKGQTVTLHSPSGMVEIEGKRRHSETEGVVLERGVLVEVLDYKGNTLLVRETVSDSESPAAPKPSQQEQNSSELKASSQNLDFEIP